MVVHSSWSSTEAKPKWRVIIETDAALDIEGYKAVTGHIMKRLNDRGFWTQKQIDAKPHLMKSAKGIHGFDVSKLNPACILFLPSQGGDPTQAYVRDVNDGRSPMPVYTVLAKADLTQDEETAVRPPCGGFEASVPAGDAHKSADAGDCREADGRQERRLRILEGPEGCDRHGAVELRVGPSWPT
jgi:hypothetical protein